MCKTPIKNEILRRELEEVGMLHSPKGSKILMKMRYMGMVEE